MIKYKLPTKIVMWENAENMEEVFVDKPLQADFCHDDCVKIKKSGYILLDFGCELRGGIAMTVQLTSKAPQTAKCRIVFGESVMEALSTIGQKNSLNDHAVRDMEVDIPNMSTSYHGSTGFRFVKIEAIDADIDIKTIKAKLEIKDIKYKGSFECDDEILNQIWKTGAYTVHLNMGDFIWDGVKRDRLVWIGDINPEISTIKTVFGYDDSVLNSLDFIKNKTTPDKWMNGIATYSIWWIINQYDWYMQQGDKEYLQEQLEYLKKLLEHIISWVDNGFTATEDMESFVDWSSKDTDSELEGVKSIFCIGLDCAKKIFDEFGMDAQSKKCAEYSEKIRYDVSDVVVNKRVAGLNILANRNVDISKQIIAGNSAKGMSCFIGYYILCAKGILDDIDDALDIVRTYWGGMLKMGATTFWEDFDIKWMENSGRIDEIVPKGKNDIHGDFGKYCYKQFRHSLCHGWASGPTAFLSEYVLGVKILEPGCKVVSIKPRLGNLKYARGTYPTPYGNIEICHEVINGKINSIINAPKGIEVIMQK